MRINNILKIFFPVKKQNIKVPSIEPHKDEIVKEIKRIIELLYHNYTPGLKKMVEYNHIRILKKRGLYGLMLYLQNQEKLYQKPIRFIRPQKPVYDSERIKIFMDEAPKWEEPKPINGIMDIIEKLANERTDKSGS